MDSSILILFPPSHIVLYLAIHIMNQIVTLTLPCNHLVELLKIKFPVLVLVASLIGNKNHIELSFCSSISEHVNNSPQLSSCKNMMMVYPILGTFIIHLKRWFPRFQDSADNFEFSAERLSENAKSIKITLFAELLTAISPIYVQSLLNLSIKTLKHTICSTKMPH